jgi:hypothetical protein
MKLAEKQSVLQSIPTQKHPALMLQGLSSSNSGYARQDTAKRLGLLHRGGFDVLPIVGVVVSIRTKLAGKRLEEMEEEKRLEEGARTLADLIRPYSKNTQNQR